MVQSGGVGIALLEHFSRLGIGISSFASVGDKMDVSGNDLLMWWEQDGLTRLAVLYLESFGNPRKFARTARRVSAHMPVLTVHAGRSAPGQRAAASHTAAVAAPLITRQALFEQAGIIATASLGALLDTAVLLANQPVPAGRTGRHRDQRRRRRGAGRRRLRGGGPERRPDQRRGPRSGCGGCCRTGPRWAGRWTPPPRSAPSSSATAC